MFNWFTKSNTDTGLAACFTGHRPQRFSFKYNENHPDCGRIKKQMETAIDSLINKGVTCFYSGMALGVDMWGAELIIKKRRFNRNIKLIAAVPCRGQENKWSLQFKERYNSILNKADDVVYLADAYTATCMQERNQYMVDNSDYIIAVYDGGSGGTGNTVKYAKGLNKKLIIIDPDSGVIQEN